jgi:ABC-type amino acid transport substrate-binding protein
VKRLGFVFFVFCLLLITVTLTAQPDPVPTLVPPTPVPVIDGGESEALIAESGIQRILNTGRMRVGILANEPPFGEFNVRGEWNGFDADLARAIAETWGVELRFKQVTRQTAREMLERSEIDMLIAAQVHRRDLDAEFEFSQTYFMGSQSMMVMAVEGGPKTLAEMANRRVGVTMATPSETALGNWTQRSGIPISVLPYPTLERTYAALIGGEVDGIVGSRHQLVRLATQPDTILIMDEAVELEPYAIAVPRQDVSLRNLVNRTLQHLRQNNKLAEIRNTYFPESSYLPAVWAGLGEEIPKPDQFATAVTYPSQFVVPRLQEQQVLRVAIQSTPDQGEVPVSLQRIDTFHRSLIDEIARRWNIRVEYVPVENPTQGMELVSSGQADVAVGVQPSWDWDEQVDFTSPYLLRGLRLMVKQNSNIAGFAELRGGKYVAYPVERPEVEDIAVQKAAEVNAVIRTFGSREQDFALALLEDNNADVAFADSIALLPLIEQYPDDLQLTKTWYSEEYLVMATPRNDADFRLLIEYTLQELVRDGTLARLLAPVMLPEDVPAFDIWPGTGEYFGFNLTG